MSTNVRVLARRFHYLLQVAADRKVPQLLGVTMALVGLGLGMSLMLVPGSFLNAPMYRDVFSLARPPVWGVLYLIVAVWLGVRSLLDRVKGQLPALAMSMLHCAFSLLTIGQAFAHDGLPTPVILFMGLSATCLITQLGFSARGVDRA